MYFPCMPLFLVLTIGVLSFVFIYSLQSINAQLDNASSTLENISVKITSPPEGKLVSTGELTISGISSDTQAKNCIVFVDWNDLKPFQPVRPAGPGGIEDYSEWIFKYDSSYHEIIEGENPLTSKITCIDGNKPLTKWNSINVTGSADGSTSISNFTQNSSTILSESKNIQQQKHHDQQDIPLQTVLPGSNPKANSTSMAVIEDNLTSAQMSNLIPLEKNSTSFELTDKQHTSLQTVLPGSNPKANSTSMEVIEDNLTSAQMSNNNNTTTSIDENVKSLKPFNSSDSKIEMVVPNESIDENQINNTNTNVTLENEKAFVNNLTTNQFPQFKEQQLQPPALEEGQQPSTLDNSNESTNVQQPESDKSPTEGMFPPFQLPSIFP